MAGEPRSLPLLCDLAGFDATSRNPNRALIEHISDYRKQFDAESGRALRGIGR